MQIVSATTFKESAFKNIVLEPTQIESNESQFAHPSYYNHFHCLFRILGFVSKRNGLASLWSGNRPQLLRQLHTWNHCGNIGIMADRYSYVTQIIFYFLILCSFDHCFICRCTIKEGTQAYTLFINYIQLSSTTTSQVFQQFKTHYQRHCPSNEVIEHFFSNVSNETLF